MINNSGQEQSEKETLIELIRIFVRILSSNKYIKKLDDDKCFDLVQNIYSILSIQSDKNKNENDEFSVYINENRPEAVVLVFSLNSGNIKTEYFLSYPQAEKLLQDLATYLGKKVKS